MAQVLKEEVRNRILVAAEKVFYEKDYRGAKLTEIAKEADIPVALIYTYFKNKEVLFDAVISSVYVNFESAFSDEESLEKGSASERFDEVGENYIHELLKERKKLIILMDKSSGTKHSEAKHKLISQMQVHIEISLKRQSKKEYDPMLAHILANNFTEGLLEIARHYQNEEWAKEMLKLIARCYYKGVESL
ncbi:TPA: TetR/AcrR family transcriptional regulator [Streptococcus equi subsp. zooepidemicus]|nr:TetR/AcrR family transcriptional regulator [Streptococcus equi subsp. zooepidemicus]